MLDAVFDDSRPIFLVDRLIQRYIQLHMMYSEIDLELLQTLLNRAEIPDIGVGQIVRLREHRIAVIVYDDLLRQFEQLPYCVTHNRCIENMIVESSIVETHQSQLRQGFDF